MPTEPPSVLEINSIASLGSKGSYVLAAETAGYSIAGLINRILDVAHELYFGTPAPRQDSNTQQEWTCEYATRSPSRPVR